MSEDVPDPKEKKISLVDLPDEDPLTGQPHGKVVLRLPVSKPHSKKAKDPRLTRLKQLDPETRVQEMSRRWRYDRPEWNTGWLLYLLSLLALQLMDFKGALDGAKQSARDNLFGAGEVFYFLITFGLDGLLKYPLVLGLLTPVFFQLRRSSPYWLEVGFDGIYTVKSFTHQSTSPSRLLVKWDEIREIKKDRAGQREILIFLGASGMIGEMLWDLTPHDKASIGVIIRELVPEGHAFYDFIKKESI
jgi:hypothetical protein